MTLKSTKRQLRDSSAKDTAERELFVTPPSKRNRREAVLGLAARKYPGISRDVADMASDWLNYIKDENGGELTPGQLYVLQEHTLVSILRNALLAKLLEGELVDEKGAAHPLLGTIQRLTELGRLFAKELGINPAPKDVVPPEPVNIGEIWAAAAQGTPTGTETDGDADTSTETPDDVDADTGDDTDADREGDTDTPGDDDGEQGNSEGVNR